MMHFHAEHALFFEQRQPLWRSTLCLGLTIGVLVLNAGSGSWRVSLGCAFVAAVLLVSAYLHGQRRIAPALTWTVALIATALLGGALLSSGATRVLEVTARVGCGVLWVLWLGTQFDWASLRRVLLTLRVPDGVVSTVDHAIMNGVLTHQEWGRRRDAARLRLGQSSLSPKVWACLLGEGALSSVQRLEAIEESGIVRSSPVTDLVVDDAVNLDMVDLERDGTVVLEKVSLRIEAGEWLLLCGPSGAGKSSLLRLLAGLDTPAQGELSRFGCEIRTGTTLAERIDGRVGLLSQNPEHHFIASTVAEDIAWGLLRRGVDAEEARHRSLEMASSLGIKHLMERPCHALSFGEQRRAALAGLLVLEPSLLLLDEPTSGLDPVAADELRNLVGQVVHRTGAACVWATHDLQTVPAQASRVVLLRDGGVVFDGPSAEGLNRSWLVRAGLARTESEGAAC